MKNVFVFNSIVKTLPAFLVAARTANFSKASSILGIPKKTLNRYISKLETYLEVTLFIRQRNQLYLTLEGEKLFSATSSSLGHIITTLHELSQSQQSECLKIGCPQELFSWLTYRLKSLQQLLPNIEIELITHESNRRYDKSDMDIAFAFGMGKWQGVESYLLFEEEVFPVCSPEFAKKHDLLGDTITPEQLINVPLVDGNWSVGRNWQGWFANFNLACTNGYEKRIQTSSYLMSLEMAKQGHGIALAWSEVFQPELYDGLLVEIPKLRLKSNVGYHMILQPENPFSEIAKKWWRLII
ncbi:Transcriptional Regulator, LysR family protein [Marinomonas sp. MED121]|uniref:LysR family transcriptional regulator n=1 Tax=Marinomonas sp. MED121 TaxID=314277 RepID=UPI00006910B7|nr:LysR family transcriptional regulator [Marinomonas sp. MED121]EAQ67723.1 Transcriptional Regulator, LysR family protein [Marinomonas sp. MED121]